MKKIIIEDLVILGCLMAGIGTIWFAMALLGTLGFQ